MRKEGGFTLIELIFSILLAALFIPALVFVFSFSLKSANQGESYTKAYTIAQQNMEAIYYLKENDPSWNWENTAQNNSSSDYYQPQNIAGTWVLGVKIAEDALVSIDGYTTSVRILPVYRDTDENIVEEDGGILDDHTRQVLVEVGWKENGLPTSIDLVSYVSDH